MPDEVKLYAMTCGWLSLPEVALIEGGAETDLRIPVPSCLIVHPQGKARFDSGLGRVCQEGAEEYMGDFASLMRVESQPGEEIAARLECLDVGVRARIA